MRLPRPGGARNDIYMRFFLTIFFLLQSSIAQAAVVDKIVALVDDKAITQSDLLEASQNPRPEWKKGRDGILRELINEKLIESELEKEKISVTEADVDAAIRNILSQAGKTLEDLKKELTGRDIPLVAYRDSIRLEVARNQFLQKIIYPRIHVSDGDIQEYYKRNAASFKSYGKIRFLQIYITEDGLAPGQSAADFAGKLSTVLKQGAPFADAVKKYSKGAFVENGGDSGILDTASLRPDLASILTSLPLNTISNPIPMGDGFFIFKVVQRDDPKQRSFAELKEALREKVTSGKVHDELERYIMESRSRHYVEIR